jgi:hypothetical protein
MQLDVCYNLSYTIVQKPIACGSCNCKLIAKGNHNLWEISFNPTHWSYAHYENNFNIKSIKKFMDIEWGCMD